MKNLKKKALMVGSYVAVAALAIGGTLAYLTDRENATNTFTVGNVDIQLNEDFEQGSELLPGVDINKDVTITNIGSSDAWVWHTYAVPTTLINAEGNAGKNAVHFNLEGEYWDQENPDGEGTWHYNGLVNNVKIDDSGIEYTIVTLLYNDVLEAGKTTNIGLSNVYLDTRVDIDPDGNMYWVENGTPVDLNWNVEENGAPKIYVNAYAIQAEEFNTVHEAYAAYSKQWGTNNNGIYVSTATASTASDVKAAIAKGGEVTITSDITASPTTAEEAGNAVTTDTAIDMNGKEYTYDLDNVDYDSLDGIGISAFAATDGATLTLTDANIVSDGYGVYAKGGDIVINGGSYIADITAVQANGGTVTIEGGYFESTSEKYGATYLLNLIDHSNSKIIVKGGTFKDFNPADNKAENPQVNFVAEGYTVTSEEIDGATYYTVVKAAE